MAEDAKYSVIAKSCKRVNVTTYNSLHPHEINLVADESTNEPARTIYIHAGIFARFSSYYCIHYNSVNNTFIDSYSNTMKINNIPVWNVVMNYCHNNIITSLESVRCDLLLILLHDLRFHSDVVNEFIEEISKKQAIDFTETRWDLVPVETIKLLAKYLYEFDKTTGIIKENKYIEFAIMHHSLLLDQYRAELIDSFSPTGKRRFSEI